VVSFDSFKSENFTGTVNRN